MGLQVLGDDGTTLIGGEPGIKALRSVIVPRCVSPSGQVSIACSPAPTLATVIALPEAIKRGLRRHFRQDLPKLIHPRARRRRCG